MKFKVLIDDTLSAVSTNPALSPIDKKRLLTLVNDYEDGQWKASKFHSFIWDNIKETALSYKERQSLALEGEDSVLTQAAINLRLSDSPDDIGKGSEISEIFLYGIMKRHYNALPIVPKIFYKQNAQDNAKGADSVHIVIEGSDSFSLWFGESKFYSSIENARFDEIIASVKDSLSLKKIKKENSLITNLSDINDFTEISSELRAKIVSFLSSETSVDLIKPILNIPILILYQCAITAGSTLFDQDYRDKICAYHKDRATNYFKKQIEKCKDLHLYSEIKFHLILFPVPEKKPIVDKFINKAKLYKS